MIEQMTLVDVPSRSSVLIKPRSLGSPRQNRAIANHAAKGFTVQLSSWPNIRFMNRETKEIEQHHINDLLDEYDQDRKEDTRMKANSRRFKA